ncbi:MAG: hypothetical protein GX640_20140 [Fibrobacter sp.]|nr:hypothetical protein [Fibrobacter sp.]
MKEDIEIKDFVERKLDQISAVGEWIGKKLGSFGRTAQKIIIAGGILVIFGIAAFLWAVGKGIIKKKS